MDRARCLARSMAYTFRMGKAWALTGTDSVDDMLCRQSKCVGQDSFTRGYHTNFSTLKFKLRTCCSVVTDLTLPPSQSPASRQISNETSRDASLSRGGNSKGLGEIRPSPIAMKVVPRCDRKVTAFFQQIPSSRQRSRRRAFPQRSRLPCRVVSGARNSTCRCAPPDVHARK